jgi:hypothetical protein
MQEQRSREAEKAEETLAPTQVAQLSMAATGDLVARVRPRGGHRPWAAARPIWRDSRPRGPSGSQRRGVGWGSRRDLGRRWGRLGFGGAGGGWGFG